MSKDQLSKQVDCSLHLTTGFRARKLDGMVENAYASHVKAWSTFDRDTSNFDQLIWLPSTDSRVSGYQPTSWLNTFRIYYIGKAVTMKNNSK